MKTIVTHNGDFHADDVFAVAVLFEAFPEEEFIIVRTRDPEWFVKGDFVVDVGGEYDPLRFRFDHHQRGAGERTNGVPYAAFGLVWKHYGEQLCGSPTCAEYIDEHYVTALDAGDVGFTLLEVKEGMYPPLSLPGIIGLFRPSWKEDATLADARFMDMVSYARILLRRIISVTQDILEAHEIVRAAYVSSHDKRVIIFDKPYPLDTLSDFPEPLFAVYPSEANGTWRATAVRVDSQSFTNRKNFPKEWGGLRDQELEVESGIPGAVFCHNALFTVAGKTKDVALSMVEKALKTP